jgi:hypothetical protein
MKRPMTIVACALSAALTLSAADPRKPGRPAPPPAVARLAWLAGAWRHELAGKVIDEQWMPPAGGVMLGMARTLVRGRVTEHAFMQVREGPGGVLYFIIQPSRQKETTFLSSSVGEREAVFENPQHDFPQKITYTLAGDGSLRVVEEGAGSDGQPRKQELMYRRAETGGTKAASP